MAYYRTTLHGVRTGRLESQINLQDFENSAEGECEEDKWSARPFSSCQGASGAVWLGGWSGHWGRRETGNRVPIPW
jgi:hypothetical protein